MAFHSIISNYTRLVWLQDLKHTRNNFCILCNNSDYQHIPLQ